ncbi:hypothetical protein JYU34_021456 [Plutella xylostella]|uniref:Uncharacterized protein n=1 Tax=Plutella xylostella TaxID=51655 RepID=A0ABQ7PXE9_PLUXY|nr:hypothetical protein JYU34_021456 [Plutella xylostella]
MSGEITPHTSPAGGYDHLAINCHTPCYHNQALNVLSILDNCSAGCTRFPLVLAALWYSWLIYTAQVPRAGAMRAMHFPPRWTSVSPHSPPPQLGCSHQWCHSAKFHEGGGTPPEAVSPGNTEDILELP